MMHTPKTRREILKGLLEQINKAMSSDAADCEKAEVCALNLHAENLGLLNQCRSEYGLSEGVESEFKYIEYWAALDPEAKKRGDWGYYFLSLKSERWHRQLDSWIRKCPEAAAGKPGVAHQATVAASSATGGPKGVSAPLRKRVGSFPKYDAFLCHAREDKDAVVRPFADLMRKRNLKPWLDEGEIRWGDNLVEKLQYGLVKSRFVVVFLSRRFLGKKRWAARELSTALSIEMGGKPRVLPLLLGITHKQLQAKYPLVAVKLCREIRDYDASKPVPRGELKKLVEELKNMIGVSVRGAEGGGP